MNRLPREKRIQVLQLLVECVGIRSISRTLGIDPHTVLSLLETAGRASATYHDLHVRNVAAENVQADEIHSFIYAKSGNLRDAKSPPPEAGDVYTWVAIDTDTKLVISYLTGGRGSAEGRMFMRDLASRISNRIQLTTDEYTVYPPAVKEAFGGNVDFEFGDATNSFVERQNLTIRTHIKRFARRTNAHSKKLENHVYAVNIHFLHYNWVRIHQTIRCTPAMEAGLTKELHDYEWLLDVIERYG
ncbi:MAG: IS1 family transposase [Deltaproteobacteria bacterium]|nr:IS1 family transposase [Deltaproteobacteria bacterium]